MKIYGYKTLGLEVKDIDAKQGIVSGYFSAFGIKDSDGDIIHPGAFAKSISDWGPSGKGRIKHLLNHDAGKPLGKITELVEDDYGLKYTSQIGTHTLGRDFLKMVESDLVKEHSIGFKDLTPTNMKDQNNGANNMTDLMLFEGSSLTAWGANEFTPLVEMKGMKVDGYMERLKAFEKFVRKTDATDETIELCLIHIKQLTQIIETMSSTQPALVAVEQPKESKEAVIDTQLLITNSLEQWKRKNLNQS